MLQTVDFYVDESGIPRRTYFIIVQTGKVPTLKRPPDPSIDGVSAFSRELFDAYQGAEIIRADFVYNGELWVSSVRETLAMDSLLAPKTRKSRAQRPEQKPPGTGRG